MEWHTNNCPITWASQGIWNTSMDGTEIYHCDSSKVPHIDGYRMLASADEFGKVRIFRYPCMVEPSQSLVCKGHSSHVTRVKFGTHHLFSAGGNDQTLM